MALHFLDDSVDDSQGFLDGAEGGAFGGTGVDREENARHAALAHTRNVELAVCIAQAEVELLLDDSPGRIAVQVEHDRALEDSASWRLRRAR